MSDDLAHQISSLAEASRAELLVQWVRLIETPPPRLPASFLRMELAYRLQEPLYGRLSPQSKTALRQAASGGPLARRPRAGARLVREWNGVTHVVEVIDGSYRYRDRTYSSLTAIAYEVTGARWSGPRFFGLKTRGKS